MISRREPLVMLVVVAVTLIQVNVLDGNLASILMSLLFFYRALNSLMSIQTSWNSFLNFSGSIDHVKAFIQELNDKKKVKVSRTIDGFGNNLTLTDVSFEYSEGIQTFRDINLSITKNETVAPVGESGAGKTTLVNMISGLLNNYQGKLSFADDNSSPFKYYKKC